MYQKMDLEQLKGLDLAEVIAIKDEATARKAELEALKAKGGKGWTNSLQEKLNDVVLFLVDVDDIIEVKQANKKAAYTPKPGTEKMVHLLIVRGRRFNPMTGKEESTPFMQMFTFAEWQLFKKNFKRLGFTIMKALHDPYGDAAELVVEK